MSDVPPAPRVTVQAPAAGTTIARLHPDDAALLARVATRPLEIEIDSAKLEDGSG